MIANRRSQPPSVTRSLEIFNATLESRGAQRGLRAERKGDASGELYIYDIIGRDWWTGDGVDAKDVLAKLDEMKGVKKLDIYINSPGGNLFDGKTIYNQLARFAAEKIVHVDGIAASAASLIAMAGDRIITEAGGTWLIHRVATGVHGFSDDLRATADQLDVETASIRSIYEQRTGKTAVELDTWMLEDRICDAVTAKMRGLTDEISECDQKRMDEEAVAAANRPAPRVLTPAELVATARARHAEIINKFPAASRGAQQPGQPGKESNIQPSNRQKVGP